jgi:hypothetical protein
MLLVRARCLSALSSAAGGPVFIDGWRGKGRARPREPSASRGPVDGDGRWWALRGGTALCAAFALVAAERAGQTDGSSVGRNWDWDWEGGGVVV